MYDKHYVGLDLTAFDDNKIMRPVSRVTFLLDNNNSITAGDDTGLEIVSDNPHATQEMANAVLAKLNGYEYHAYNASSANLDPAAELGDGITVNGIYGAICRLDDGGTGYPGVNAPGEAELEDEYPSAGPMTQEFNRKIAQTRSTITKTAEQIRLEVANEIDEMSASITLQLDSITSTVKDAQGNISRLQQTATSLQSQINTANGNISSIEQYAHSITLSVSNGSTSSTIKLMAGSAEIDSENITFTGFVTFTGLSSGTTTIDGACIKTGTISANRIDLTGSITWSSLDNSVQSNINGAYNAASEASSLAKQLANGTYSGGTFINGKAIYSPNIYANSLSIYATSGNGAFNLYAGNYRALDIEYSDVGIVSFNGGNAGQFLFNTATVFSKNVQFTGGVSGISLSLAPAESKPAAYSNAAFEWTSLNGERKRENELVNLSDDNGVLKIELPGATWYLDETGLHK